jgi:HAD superfamily hydrolase (TIGR01450 family)
MRLPTWPRDDPGTLMSVASERSAPLIQHAPALVPAPLGYVFDLDGTVYLGEALLPGAAETIRALRVAGRRTLFLTNKPLERPADYAAKLTRLGVPTDVADVVTSTDSLVHYLERHQPGGPVLTIAEPLVGSLLVEAGHDVTEDPSLAAMVVVSWDRSFDYAKLERAFHAVRNGARIVATNPDPYCPGPDGPQPDCAAMLAALEACTERRAEAIVGKPSEHMAATLLARLSLPPDAVALVGDRLLTDVGMARRAGMCAVLVLTGATAPVDLAATGAPQPDLVIEDIGQLIARLS